MLEGGVPDGVEAVIEWVDPTYGRIDRDIQDFVEAEFKTTNVGTRVALENTLQAKRDRGQRLRCDPKEAPDGRD